MEDKNNIDSKTMQGINELLFQAMSKLLALQKVLVDKNVATAEEILTKEKEIAESIAASITAALKK